MKTNIDLTKDFTMNDVMSTEFFLYFKEYIKKMVEDQKIAKRDRKDEKHPCPDKRKYSCYDAYYSIHAWEINESHSTDECVNLILINNEIYNFDYLKWRIDWLYYEFDDCVERVIEVTKDYVKNYFAENDIIFDEDDFMLDDKKIKFPIYIVKGVIYNPNKDVMKKVVYDSIAKYKAEKEGI